MKKIVKALTQTKGERNRAYARKHDAECYANLAALAARREA